jgi:hypothetical protein
MTKQINQAFLKMSAELKRFKLVCQKNNSRIRSVNFKVLNNGETRLHVVYRRK